MRRGQRRPKEQSRQGTGQRPVDESGEVAVSRRAVREVLEQHPLETPDAFRGTERHREARHELRSGARRARHRCGRSRYCGTSDGRHTTPTSRPSRFRTGPAEALRSAGASRCVKSVSRENEDEAIVDVEGSTGSPDGAPIHWTAIPRRARALRPKVGRPCATRLTVENPAPDGARTARTAKG